MRPVTLQGPCMPHLVLQIDGIVLAPQTIGAWPKFNTYQWINFKWLQNFTIQGSGTVDGHGSSWWNLSQTHHNQKKSRYSSKTRLTALRFYQSYNVTVRDIKIIDSPQCHLKFDSSRVIKVQNITIVSPGDSPNTDGVHLQNTHDVEIWNSSIGCGKKFNGFVTT
ncbi:hypothetical protein QJS10_CPB14g00086 [Acorus calamus]|uniref:Polygalacturonase n=1 Tax=Acorus calamus TaxID=4465 RepID=A0AAV9DAC3_ACOCL|nr:hypothetical protein QJS10_CPB14g00086 [Acorus calamus]